MSLNQDSTFDPKNVNTFCDSFGFCRAPLYKFGQPHQCDWAIIGIPFDVATTNRPGARFGPQAIRKASTQLESLLSYPYAINPFRHLKIVDYGDIGFNLGYPEQFPDIVTNAINEIIHTNAKTFCFGGDHFITYPILRAMHRKHGKIALIHFDAHPDTWPDDGQELNHGTMFDRAANEGLLDPKASIQIGIRTQCPNKHNFKIIHAHQVHDIGTKKVIEQIIATVQNRPVYLTFDIDCLDPAFAPGTGTPVCGGLSSAQALAILRGLQAINLIGADVVEVAPAYDHSAITALAGAHIVHEILSQDALRKKNKKR